MAAAAVAAETSVRQQNKAKFDEQLALHEAAQRRYTYLPFARPCTADQPAATNISSPSDGICTSQPAKRRCVRRSSTLHRSLALQAMAIPKAEGIPAYKAWSYRRDMENASRTGHRLFYSEKATGETRLASDDEYEYGDFLARSPASLSQSQEDRGGPSQQPAQQAEDVDLTEMRRRRRTPARPTPAKAHAVGERMVGAFCRRCYAYNCPLHAGDLQVRPHQPPVHASVPVPAVPCGPHCFRLQPSERAQQESPSPGSSAAAAVPAASGDAERAGRAERADLDSAFGLHDGKDAALADATSPPSHPEPAEPGLDPASNTLDQRIGEASPANPPDPSEQHTPQRQHRQTDESSSQQGMEGQQQQQWPDPGDVAEPPQQQMEERQPQEPRQVGAGSNAPQQQLQPSGRADVLSPPQHDKAQQQQRRQHTNGQVTSPSPPHQDTAQQQQPRRQQPQRRAMPISHLAAAAAKRPAGVPELVDLTVDSPCSSGDSVMDLTLEDSDAEQPHPGPGPGDAVHLRDTASADRSQAVAMGAAPATGGSNTATAMDIDPSAALAAQAAQAAAKAGPQPTRMDIEPRLPGGLGTGLPARSVSEAADVTHLCKSPSPQQQQAQQGQQGQHGDGHTDDDDEDEEDGLVVDLDQDPITDGPWQRLGGRAGRSRLGSRVWGVRSVRPGSASPSDLPGPASASHAGNLAALGSRKSTSAGQTGRPGPVDTTQAGNPSNVQSRQPEAMTAAAGLHMSAAAPMPAVGNAAALREAAANAAAPGLQTEGQTEGLPAAASGSASPVVDPIPASRLAAHAPAMRSTGVADMARPGTYRPQPAAFGGSTEPAGALLGSEAHARALSDDDWSPTEAALFSQGLRLYPKDPCSLAKLIASRDCRQVRQRMLALPPEVRPSSAATAAVAAATAAAGLPNKRKGKGKPPGNSAAILRMRDKHAPDVLWDSYKPCTCTGVCTRACPCFGSENFCEKYCGCSAACQFRFKGCTCSKGGCKARSCACFAAGRDCDPDLCHGCSIACAHELQPGGPAGTAGTAAPPGREPCANMRLRTRQHKRTAVGLSSTCGWGTFLLEAAKEGDLIGEYKGERIDSAEADRRGKTYDIDDNTYLFNLNKDWVVDARPCGDKLRFANHSTNPNCQTKFRLVDGEHRLAIFAVRDLPPGSELFYDYDFAKGTEPAWYQRKQAATGQQRRGGGAGGRGGTGRKQAAAVDKS